MTQTLMDFMQLVVSSDPVHRPVKSPLANSLADRRAEFDDALSQLNAEIAQQTNGGQLVAAPLCPSACEPGALAEAVLSLGTHPFARWNMMLYADTVRTASILDTIQFHPDYQNDTDSVMAEYIMGLTRATADHLQRLQRDSARIEATLFGDSISWAGRIDPTARYRPSSAAINPAMSSGSAASNDISQSVTG